MIYKVLAGLATIFSSIFFIFRKGKKAGEKKAIENINQEIKKEKEKIIEQDEKIKKEIANTEFSDRINFLQNLAKNRRNSD